MRYFLLTLKHKWFVLLAGLRLGGIPLWRLIIHDWSKLTPSELPAYNRQFFGDGTSPNFEFERAWLHHQNHNPHHWEYWISRTSHNKSGGGPGSGEQILPMPETYVREMVADWLGASRAYEGYWPHKTGRWTWLEVHWNRIQG